MRLREPPVTREGAETARRILKLREEHRALVTTRLKNSRAGFQLLDRLFEQPVVTVDDLQDRATRLYLARFLLKDIHKRGLGSLNLRGKYGLFADVHLDEEV